MIDISHETPITLAQAAASLPRRRGGRRTHVATLYRWSTRGCRGVVLETVQVGGTRCTTQEALQRFCEALTRSAGLGAGEATPTDTAHAGELQAKLEAEGL